MKRLKAELLKLKGQGSSLTSEIEALLSVNPPKEVSLPQKLLALASAEIQKGNFEFAHDCIGAAIEAHQTKEPIELTAEFKTRLQKLGEVKANDSALKIPLPDLGDETSLADAPNDLVTAFADTLISAGYLQEAKSYIGAFNNLNKESEMAIDKRKALLELRAGFKKDGRLDMVRAADEMLDELKEGGESKAGSMLEEAKGCPDEEVKSAMMKASYMMKAAEEMEKDGHDASKMKEEAEGHMAKARDMLTEQSEPQEYQAHASVEKPKLLVEAASSKEQRLRAEASKLAGRGELKKAKSVLAQADSLERARFIAALITAGDSEMAMDGLKEEEKEQGGFPAKADDEEATKEKDEEVKEDQEKSELPEEHKATEEPTKEPEVPEEHKDEEKGEEELAKDLQHKVESSVKKGRIRTAVKAFSELNKLEQVVVAGVKLTKNNKKLAKEGFAVWKAVAKARLGAEAVLAEHEEEEEVHDKAMEGMEKLEDESQAHEELDKALEDMDESKAEELTKDFIVPPGGKGETAPGGDSGPAEVEHHEEEEEVEEEMEEGKEEEQEKGEIAESMHYEVLQSLEDLKALKVDRNALAFTFWEDDKGHSPFYVIQAAGKPIGEIHLGDQDNADEIRAYFCDETKYTKALAQSVENTNLFEMLKGVHARFYANAVETTAFAKKMKAEATASVSDVRTEKLAQLRKDFTEALVCASEALNKGLYDKPNALKSTFVKVLSSYGIMNPAIAVEAAFKEAGSVFFDQVLDGATEYLEMPKEAFAHAKKMIRQAQNVAYANANNYADMSIGQRLANNSLPLGSVPEREEAPIVASTREWSERARVDNYKAALKLGRKI
jgi:hypothetical protein